MDSADDQFHEVGRRIAAVTGQRRTKQVLLQRLGAAIQRGNEASVLRTVGYDSHDSKLDVVYFFVKAVVLV